MEEEFKIKKQKPRIIQQILSVKTLVILICILIISSIGTLVWQYTLNSKISQGLKGVYITDITDRSAVVSWVTSQPIKTELLYSEEKIESVINKIKAERGYDIRDLEEVDELEYRLNKRGNYYVHSVLLRNLSPQTEYHFALKNGLFLNSSAHINYFSTSKEFDQIDTPEIAYGNVMNQEGKLISDTLLIFEVTNENDDNKSQQVSYVMDGNTGWSINIRNLLDSNLEQKYIKDEQSYLGMYIINASGEITKIFDDDMIKPAENISAYDNEYEKEESNVKGVMAVLIDGSCTCENCTVSCPTGYVSSCPIGWNCTSKTVTCTKKYRCSNGEESTCGTNSKTCYLKTSPKQTCTCESCTPYCPTGYTFSCPAGSNCAEINSICDRYDSCTEERCGSQTGATCYKPTTLIPTNSTPVNGTLDPVSCAKQWLPNLNYAGRMQSYYWCNCPDPVQDACVGALDLAYGYNGSCVSYCAEKQKEPQKAEENKISHCDENGNLINKDGESILCQYGCQDNGEEIDDICNAKHSSFRQEIDCSRYSSEAICNSAGEVGGGCVWSGENNICSSSPYVSCEDIKNENKCDNTANCSYIDGKCSEINTQGYMVKWAQAGENARGYCSGFKDNSGEPIGIGSGTFSIGTHQSNHSCSVDILAYEADISTQIVGWNTQTNDWGQGYSCVTNPGKYQDKGYGKFIVVTQPNGEELIFAHLKYATCEGKVVTGQTGGVSPHLHMEVKCSSSSDCGECLSNKNPCNYVPGGCFECADEVKITALERGTLQDPNNRVMGRSYLSFLISKVKAADFEYLNPTRLIEDLSLPEGEYIVNLGSTSKTTSFIKTDNTHIVFFEDDNGNGKLDSQEAILSPYEAQVEYNVTYERTADSYTLTLQEGYNLVSFPILFKDENEKEIKKASELIEYLNERGTEITSLTAYRGGKFLPYVIREGNAFGDDFNILPGEGYFVKSNSSGEFLYSGTKVKDGLEILLYEGWNLVNIYNSNVKSYSGFEILKQMKDQSVGADILNKWEDGTYEGIVSEESGEYGTDFNVYQNRGYFVRVKENSGPFTPK